MDTVLENELTDTLPVGEHTYFTGGAIKAVGDGKIEGYLAVWGSPSQRDSYGEYFTKSTNFELQRYKDWPLLYHHELDPTVGGLEVGRIHNIIPDDYGLLAQAQLDMTIPEANRFYNDVLRGKLFWSSGSVPHWVNTTPGGEITRWPITEGTLTPAPAEKSGRTSVYAIRSAMTALEQDNGEPSKEPQAKETPAKRHVLSALMKFRIDLIYNKGTKLS